jgi:hypothetical protein
MKRSKIVIWIILGIIFIYSGFSKAINVFSFSQTILSFNELLGLSVFYRCGEVLAILICMVECLLPLLSLRRVNRSYVVWSYPIILGFFTSITYVNNTSLYGGIESCGCFGEIIHLSPAVSFYKSMGLLVLSLLLLFFHLMESRNGRTPLFPTIKLDCYVIMAIMTSIVPPLFSYLFMERLPHVLYVILFLSIIVIGMFLCLKYIMDINTNKSQRCYIEV